MPGILDGLAATVYRAFENKLDLGTLRQEQGGIQNDLGDKVRSEVVEYPCQGFTDKYNDVFRARAGIPEGDVKVMIFGASLPAGVRPGKDDKVMMNAAWWQIRKAETDPATALWECQSFSIPPQGES